MTAGEALMRKYPIGVTERIAKEIDDAIRLAIEEDRKAKDIQLGRWLTFCFVTGMLGGSLGQYLLRS